VGKRLPQANVTPAMTETQILILEHLSYMRTAIDELSEDIREVKTRLDKLIEANASIHSACDVVECTDDRSRKSYS